jgi:ABC-type transport system involved in Fe-S cluster assembly fused permease/ATPase subunit
MVLDKIVFSYGYVNLRISGDIYIDDVNINKIDKHSLRDQIGVVLQDNYLFQESVRANIAHKNPTVKLIFSSTKLPVGVYLKDTFLSSIFPCNLCGT